MKKPRKNSDIWKAIDDQRILLGMKEIQWKQSFEGVKAAIEHIGHIMITTKEDLDKMEIPITRVGNKRYGRRKIEISRNGIISKTRIDDILSCNSSLKTVEEIAEIYKQKGLTLSIDRPKGIPTNNNAESKAIDDLDILINISDNVYREHLYEHRLYDIAYCLIDEDIDKEVFVADQIKSARVCENGRVYFNASSTTLNVGSMISILENGSLTCIGKNLDNKVDVVWFFYGIDAINELNKFKINQLFEPTLHLQIKSYNEFTIAINNSIFRFDVGKSEKECNRLLERKLEFIKNGNKHSLTFWNEDDSQIPCKEHRIEQQSFNMTREGCNKIGIKVIKRHEDSYSVVDFIVNGIVKVQDKASTEKFNMRKKGGLPYNPNDIDILQVSDLVNNIVYAIPMRVIKDDIITSFFTVEQLMKGTIHLTVKWKEYHKQFKHDFKNKKGILSYVKECENTNKIPKLTDVNFYSNMINENKDKFGSKKNFRKKVNV
jgi:hypothetical protein